MSSDNPLYDKLQKLIEDGIELHELSGVDHPLAETIADVLWPEVKAYLPQPTWPKAYQPQFGDDRDCTCGHPYYRHFDTYDDMSPVGCKYCECFEFKLVVV